MDITKLTLVELKSMIFDLQNDLQIISQELQKRLQAPKEPVEAPKEEKPKK